MTQEIKKVKSVLSEYEKNTKNEAKIKKEETALFKDEI